MQWDIVCVDWVRNRRYGRFCKKNLPIITTSIIAVVTHIRGTLHGGHLRGGGYSYKSKSKSKGNNKESCIPNDQLWQLQPVCIINVEILIQSENMISRFSLVLTCRNLTLAVTLTPFSPSICKIYFICRTFLFAGFLFAGFLFAGFFICRIFLFAGFLWQLHKTHDPWFWSVSDLCITKTTQYLNHPVHMINWNLFVDT